MRIITNLVVALIFGATSVYLFLQSDTRAIVMGFVFAFASLVFVVFLFASAKHDSFQ